MKTWIMPWMEIWNRKINETLDWCIDQASQISSICKSCFLSTSELCDKIWLRVTRTIDTKPNPYKFSWCC
ncbi:MAG: hypothetical protein ACD_4C00133G0005 [uncultured bacterium (gcode 4)]|uniref:Uncharacterized protein n=1 Tax=uncultured bacterium (gcode 4) TaxID=1234023 RepID=K2FYA4_9BACT|nr:MAG: hypothetical protein ACD_4C00133G0005 [uncultured bacterium (gcode 4)]